MSNQDEYRQRLGPLEVRAKRLGRLWFTLDLRCAGVGRLFGSVGAERRLDRFAAKSTSRELEELYATVDGVHRQKMARGDFSRPPRPRLW